MKRDTINGSDEKVGDKGRLGVCSRYQ